MIKFKNGNCLYKHKVSMVFFLSYLLVGIFIFKDYGIGWDEGICIRSGIINSLEINRKLNYAIIPKEKVNDLTKKEDFNSKITNLDSFVDKYYGAINEIILLAPSFLLKLYKNPQYVILVRHFMIFLIFWISTIFFYKLLYERFNNIKIALIGTLFLILSPRIFADSFYNSKDLVFLSFTILAIYTSIKFLEKKNLTYAIINALSSAILIDIRIPGVFIPALTISFYIANIYINRNNFKLTNVKQISLYFLFLIFFVILFWPFLWTTNPISQFIEAFNRMSNFPYTLDVFYFGKLIKPNEIPWHYSFVWLFITTPIYITVFFIVGVIFYIKRIILFKMTSNNQTLLKDSYLILCFIFPLLTVILLNSTLYNGWRQLFFIYPGYIYFAIYGFNKIITLYEKRIYKTIMYSALTILLSISLYQLIILHPYQMLYFNIFAGQNPQQKFECEYWGLSYKEGIKKVIEVENKSKQINIFEGEFSPIKGTYRVLDEKDRKRIKFTDFGEADYFLTNYTEYYNNQKKFMKRYHLKHDQEIDSICVNNIKILSIFKLTKNNKIDSSIKIRMLSDGAIKNNQNR